MLNGITPKIQHRKWGPTKSIDILLQSGVDFGIFPKIFVGWFIAFPHTLPTAEILSGKNEQALVSMVLYLKNKWKLKY